MRAEGSEPVTEVNRDDGRSDTSSSRGRELLASSATSSAGRGGSFLTPSTLLGSPSTTRRMTSMSDPYRASPPPAVPARARMRVAEPEPAPLRLFIRVRAWSDGSTELFFGERTQLLPMLAFGLLSLLSAGIAVLVVASCLSKRNFTDAFGAVSLLGFAAWSGWAGLGALVGGERVAVSPAALVYRPRPWRKPTVMLIDDVSSVVMTGGGKAARVDVQAGRQTHRILEKAYTEAQLRWCAQRLRRALDHARAARIP